MRLNTFVFCCAILFIGFVNAHQIISLLRYADVTCERTLSPPVKVNEEGVIIPDKGQFTWETTKCKHEFLGIITPQGNLADLDMMAFNLGYIFGESSYQIGMKLAYQIHEKCGEKIASLKNKPAKEWEPFFMCVSGITKWDNLKGRSGRPEDREYERLRNIQLTQEEINQIRPKLDCHPHYETNSSNWERGEGLCRFAYKFCKYGRGQEEMCMDECMVQQFGLIEPTLSHWKKVQWTDETTMTSRLRNIFQREPLIQNYKTAKELAKKIRSGCATKVLQEPYLRSLCNTYGWSQFFECVNPIFDCAKK